MAPNDNASEALSADDTQKLQEKRRKDRLTHAISLNVLFLMLAGIGM